MRKILALWAVPRSTSTAFEWMMRQRGDLQCFHEPFGEAWYQGEAPLWPRVADDSVRTPGLTLDSVERDLRAAAESAAAGNTGVFIKDFPHYLSGRWNESLYALFCHTFLIRDPAKTLTSMYDKWPDFHPGEVGFIEQRELFDRLCDRDGVAPPVIDSDDLLEDPASVVEHWCRASGIPFLPEALTWAPGARDEVSWWDGGSFHANLRNSDGLKPQPRKYVELSRLPERVKQLHDELRPHYEHLLSHRLR